MTRTGLIAAALVLAAAAIGFFFWADLLRLSGQSSPPSREGQLVAKMTVAASGGGYAVTFSSGDAAKWQIADGHKLERFSVDGEDVSFARLSSNTPLDAATWEWATQGLSATFPVDFNNQTNGQRVEIGVIARAPSANATGAISVVYATQQAGNSGWRELALGGEFALSTFTFDVPKVEPGSYSKQPIVVINADPTGTGRSAEILGVYVKKL